MRKPRKETVSETPEEPGSQDAPTQEDLVRLPPGFGFAADTEEEGTENLEDLETPEGDEEGEEEEPEPETLTPRERALQQQLDEAQGTIGRQGEELGRLRQQPPAGQPQGIVPVQGQPQADPFEQMMVEATEEFVRTADHAKYAATINRITNQKIMAAGQFFQEQIRTETKAEADFFAKNSDLMDGLPRSIFEGEVAKLKLVSARMPATEQRRMAADATREALKGLHGRLVDEDEAAAGEARKLRGPGGRRSRTGTQQPSGGGLATVLQGTKAYIADHQAQQARTQSRS